MNEASKTVTGQGDARNLPTIVGEWVGIAIARDVIRGDCPHKWTGLDPQEWMRWNPGGSPITPQRGRSRKRQRNGPT